MADLIIFDMDGTLADVAHRRHHVAGKRKHWGRFFAGCADDTPCAPLFDLMRALLKTGYEVQIWSGRPEHTRAASEDWLKKHGCDLAIVRMRPDGDYQPDDLLKETWLHSLPRPPVLVFDDRNKVVAMWRRNGIVCAQVAEGDF